MVASFSDTFTIYTNYAPKNTHKRVLLFVESGSGISVLLSSTNSVIKKS
jgi:hypothetical protein